MDAMAIYVTLKNRIDDNYIMTIVMVLGSTNMPLCQIGLANWDDVVELEVSCARYDVQRELNGRRIPPF